MKMTIGEVLDKIDSMRALVRAIESGGSVDQWSNEIAEYLDEYILILSNTKVEV
jgi:hypothetical protein